MAADEETEKNPSDHRRVRPARPLGEPDPPDDDDTQGWLKYGKRSERVLPSLDRSSPAERTQKRLKALLAQKPMPKDVADTLKAMAKGADNLEAFLASHSITPEIPENVAIPFSQFLRDHIQDAEVTDSELADAAGISIRTLQGYLAKKPSQKNPSFANVLRLCVALKVDIREVSLCTDFASIFTHKKA